MFLQSLLWLPALLCGAVATIKTYPVPSGIPQSTAFQVQVRQGYQSWQNLSIYQINLHEINITTGNAFKHKSSVAYFDFSDNVEVSIQYKNAPAKSVRVRPDSYGIAPALQKDNKITLNLAEPRNLVIQYDDEIFDCLHLLASGLETYVPSPNDTDVLYYGPGVHGTKGQVMEIPSGKTVYLAGGAILQSGVTFNGSTDVAIRGRGMVYSTNGGTGTGLIVDGSNNTLIDGIILINSGLNVGESDGVHVRNIKSFSAIQWGDGMDFYCSKNILVEGVFMRNSDDCIALYQHRNQWYGSSSNITIQDSSLWADVAHPINIGTHGSTDNPETMSSVTIKNIDILDHREAQVDYQGCIAINPGDSNLIKDVYISDIRVEDFRIGQLFNMRVMYNEKYNTSPGRGIHNVTVNNLSYNGTHANQAIFVGYDEDRRIEFVTFKGLKINGKTLFDKMKKPAWYKTMDLMPGYYNEHVRNITFLE